MSVVVQFSDRNDLNVQLILKFTIIELFCKMELYTHNLEECATNKRTIWKNVLQFQGTQFGDHFSKKKMSH